MTASLRTALLTCACVVALASCDGPDKPTTAPAAVARGEPGALLTSMRDLQGFWLIERFEDFEPSWQNGTPWRSAYVQIDDGRMTYNIGCNRSGNPVSLGDDGVLRDTGDGSRMQTMQGCGPVREARDGRFFAFFGNDPEVRALGSGRVSLKSSASELILIQPELWRRLHKPDWSQVEGRWVPQMASEYEGWGSSGFGIGENPGVVTIARGHVMWSRCPDLPIPVRWSADGQLQATDAIDVTRCPAVAGAADDGPSALMTMLAASPAVIRMGADRIVLVDGSGEKGRRLDLQSEESVLNPPPLPQPMPGAPVPPPSPPPA